MILKSEETLQLFEVTVLQGTDNYYVIVTRESLDNLPYSVEEIYGIRNAGKYGGLKQTYNELFHIYGGGSVREKVRPEWVLTEDSNAGFQFFQNICDENQIKCISANGKSNVFPKILEYVDQQLLVIADGAAFGAEVERIMQLIRHKRNIALYLPESFEWLILKSGVVNNKEIEHILEEPSAHIDSKEYMSWERYFSALLVEKTKGMYLKYTKSKLNPVYMQSTIREKIVDVMEKIAL